MVSLAQVQNDLIVQSPFLYVYGFKIDAIGITTFNVGPGQCRDSNNNIDIGLGNLFPPGNQGLIVNTPITVNATINGLNGLDTGTLLASTWYSVYVIADSKYHQPIGMIMTLSTNSVPLLPAGYDSYRLIGYMLTDVSANLVEMTIYGNGNDRQYLFHQAIELLVGGTSTSFAPIDFTPSLPANLGRFVRIYTQTHFTPATAGNVVRFNPHGSRYPSLTSISAVVAGVQQNMGYDLLVGDNYIMDYQIAGSGGGSFDMYSLGFEASI